MSSYSAMQSPLVLEALRSYDFSKIRKLCDIGGGYGHLICSILQKYPHPSGKVVDIEPVVKNTDMQLAHKMGVGTRCAYILGDMFKAVRKSDAYIMKLILHDWNDEECVRILTYIYKVAPPSASALIAEHIVQGSDSPDFARLFDIHVLCALTGGEQTAQEYARLLERAGFKFIKTHYPR